MVGLVLELPEPRARASLPRDRGCCVYDLDFHFYSIMAREGVELKHYHAHAPGGMWYIWPPSYRARRASG